MLFRSFLSSFRQACVPCGTCGRSDMVHTRDTMKPAEALCASITGWMGCHRPDICSDYLRFVACNRLCVQGGVAVRAHVL